jgi:hypothetical protein
MEEAKDTRQICAKMFDSEVEGRRWIYHTDSLHCDNDVTLH